MVFFTWFTSTWMCCRPDWLHIISQQPYTFTLSSQKVKRWVLLQSWKASLANINSQGFLYLWNSFWSLCVIHSMKAGLSRFFCYCCCSGIKTAVFLHCHITVILKCDFYRCDEKWTIVTDLTCRLFVYACSCVGGSWSYIFVVLFFWCHVPF